MERFGIFSPTLGLKADYPTLLLEAGYTPEAQNVRVVSGEIHRARMRYDLFSDLSNPILHYHWFPKADGTAYLFAFEGAEIQKWVPATPEWVTHTTFTPSAATEWVTAQFGDLVIATNNQDKVQKGDNSTAFTELDVTDQGLEYATTTYVTKARWVAVFENYVIVGDTTEGGTRYPFRVRWCDLGDSANWLSGDADYVDIGGEDPTTGSVHYRDSFIVFKERSIHRMTLAADALIWTVDEITNAYGCLAPKSAVLTKRGDLLFLASDKKIRTLDGEEVSRPIADTFLAIPDSQITKVHAMRMNELGQIWWSIPSASGSTNCDKIITLDEDTGTWGQLGIAISAFGRWRNETTYEYNDLGAGTPWRTYDDCDWETYDMLEGEDKFMLDIGGDASGNNYALHGSNLDVGASYTAYFTLASDLVEGLDTLNYKRLLNLRLYVRAEGAGTLAISVKRDHEASWQEIGSVSLVHAALDIVGVDLPCDYRARHFQLRIEGSNVFRFLGVMFEFVYDGTG